MAYTSRLLADIGNIRHAFLDMHESAQLDKQQLVAIRQVHGAEILTFTAPLDHRPEADGVFTECCGEPIGVATADCLPLLMASRNGQYVSAVHAGWRGLSQGIIQRSVALFHERDIAAKDILIAAGPHIGPCCYEVSAAFYTDLLATPYGACSKPELQTLFSSSAQNAGTHSARPRGSNHLWFNLSAFCQLQLHDAGIATANVDWFPVCTYCHPASLDSFRRRNHFPAAKKQQISWISKV